MIDVINCMCIYPCLTTNPNFVECQSCGKKESINACLLVVTTTTSSRSRHRIAFARAFSMFLTGSSTRSHWKEFVLARDQSFRKG